jgi:hypothetical protein
MPGPFFVSIVLTPTLSRPREREQNAKAPGLVKSVLDTCLDCQGKNRCKLMSWNGLESSYKGKASGAIPINPGSFHKVQAGYRRLLQN